MTRHAAQTLLKRHGYADGGGVADPEIKKAAAAAFYQAHKRDPPIRDGWADTLKDFKTAAGALLTKDTPRDEIGAVR